MEYPTLVQQVAPDLTRLSITLTSLENEDVAQHV